MNYCFIVLLDYWQLGPLSQTRFLPPALTQRTGMKLTFWQRWTNTFFNFEALNFLNLFLDYNSTIHFFSSPKLQRSFMQNFNSHFQKQPLMQIRILFHKGFKYGGRLKPATLLKVTLLHVCFSRFLNCTNGIKSRNASHIFFRLAIIDQ